MSLALFGVFIVNSPFREKILGRIKNRLFPPKYVPDDRKRIAVLPEEGDKISVETALNSRCCGDGTGNQRWLHWGMFDNETKLSPEQIESVINSATTFRFTDHRVEVTAEDGMLTFSIENRLSGLDREWAMIESGMQQQAVGLVCAALAVGMVFRNLGKDGTVVSDNVYGNVRYRIDPMRPSYDGKYWTHTAQIKEKPWKSGNLPDPRRDGTMPLVRALAGLRTEQGAGSKLISKADVGQLLWAARGRTPHFYKSKPWGMTIPFWTDKIEASSVYWVENSMIFQYINWENGRPTHSIRERGSLCYQAQEAFRNLFQNRQHAVIFCRNDPHARALWEIGYGLMNLMVQAHALDISYTASLLRTDEKAIFIKPSMTDPVALVAI